MFRRRLATPSRVSPYLDDDAGTGCGKGHFELNVFTPVIIDAVLQSVRLPGDVAETFRAHCIDGIAADRARIDAQMRRSLKLAATLAPRIGYDAAAKIAKAARRDGTTLREAAVASRLVSPAEFDALVRPEAMTGPK